MLAFFTPAFWIMMIQMNALHLRMVPGSQAAEPRRRQYKRRHPRTTPSPQTTQTSATSGGAAQTYHDTPATPQLEKTTPRGGASIAPSTSLTTAPTGGNSGGQKKPTRRHDGTRPPGESFGRISEISDEEVCPSCQCLLTRSEINQNKVGKARRGRCNDCFRRMPAPIANMGSPSYSSRGLGAAMIDGRSLLST